MPPESSSPRQGTLTAGNGRTRLLLNWQRRGRDLHVHIGGGDEHVGAVALVGRQADGEVFEGVLHLPPHKETELALDAARKLHAATGVSVCVTAGVHLETITPAEIATVLRNADRAVARLAVLLRSPSP